jgi:hypothetical protein
MPKGPCDKLKKSKDPKCTDKAECDWFPGKGCYPKGTSFEPKNTMSKSKSSEKSTSISDESELRRRYEALAAPVQQEYNTEEEAAVMLLGMKGENISSRYSFNMAPIFLVDLPDAVFKYPPFPGEVILVDDRDDNQTECYMPEWIYRKDSRTNHIKCKSEDEYERLASEYHKQMEHERTAWKNEKNRSVLQKIIDNGGKEGDLVQDLTHYNAGYRTTGVYVLVTNTSGELELSELGSEVDDYGNIPSTLSLSDKFNPGYWSFSLEYGNVINLTDREDALLSASWHALEEQEEPLHLSKLKGLRKTQIKSDENGNLVINLGFMILKYDGRTLTRDELHSALKSKNIFEYFLGNNNTLYVRPTSDGKTSLLVH